MIESWLWVGYKVFKERGGREMKEKDKGIFFVFINYFFLELVELNFFFLDWYVWFWCVKYFFCFFLLEICWCVKCLIINWILFDFYVIKDNLIKYGFGGLMMFFVNDMVVICC